MRYIKSRNKFHTTAIRLFSIVVLCCIVLNYRTGIRAWIITRTQHQNNVFNQVKFLNHTLPSNRTLIIYVFGKTHESAEENLAFFIRTAVRDFHNADYYFILQQINVTHFDLSKLPPLPSNGHYIQHENKCFDLGTVGWLLSTGRVDKNKYKYFIFLNSSVRGPFIVAYYQDPVWYTIFIRRLNDYIRLVGCTFSCQIEAHIQSYLWAMSLDTLNFLLNKSKVFTCHKSMRKAIDNGEIGASRALLRAGYGIDSLMTKYQGLDLRTNSSAKCLSKRNPTKNNAVDSLSLDPYEVVFVKVKVNVHKFSNNLKRAVVYEKWLNR